MRMLLALLALVVFAAVCAVLAFAVDWEVLREDAVGAGVFVASAVGLGLLAARWKALFAAVLPALAVLASELRPDQSTGALIAVSAGVAALTAAVCLLVGVGAGKLLGRAGRRHAATPAWREADTSTRTRPGAGAVVAAVLGALLVLAATATVALSAYFEYRFVDEQPERPLVVNERKASFRGVAVGDSVRRARKVFGPGQKGADQFEPLGADPSELSTPTSIPSLSVLRYRELVVFVARGRVRGFTTTDPDAETKAGAGVGDSLRAAKRVYRNLECDTETDRGDETTLAYPYCAGNLGGGVYLWLGGNPIDNITVLDDRELTPEGGRLEIKSR
ncbi:MAG: hypothetical protein ACR2ML_01540 [Solirubrobacteraceae bacterium]